MKQNSMVKVVNIFFFIIMSLAITGFVIYGHRRFVTRAAGLAILYLCFILLEKYKGQFMENYVRVFVLLNILGHTLGGDYLNLYNTSPHYDKILHIIGGFSFSLLAFSLIKKLIDLKLNSKPFIFILVVSLGIALGSLFEIAEFTEDFFLGMNNQKGLMDTNIDMIFNTLGAILAGIFSISTKIP